MGTPWQNHHFILRNQDLLFLAIAMTPQDIQFLRNESLSLLSRLSTVQPFALNTPMVRAAAVSAEAQDLINEHMSKIKQEIHEKVGAFIAWLQSPDNQHITAAKAQSIYALLKLRFNNMLDQLDIFGAVLVQRGEHNTGTWVAGLDTLAMDTLNLPGKYYSSPPIICFLERGHGAAIRRARTRLPGGDSNPVGIIQVPRERMIGSGIASSLIHEVGHQGSELLNLTTSIRSEIKQIMNQTQQKTPWALFSRWLNEIISDFWAMAHLGITATNGLMSVVSLPSYFVFRIGVDGPHPFPWIRVKISIAFGRELYPHPQWDILAKQWESFYPTQELPKQKQELIALLEKTLPDFTKMVVNHKPVSLKGRVLKEIFPYQLRQPAQLQVTYSQWRKQPKLTQTVAPSLAFAIIGQAKADGNITAKEESKLLTRLLTHWALNRAKGYCVEK